MASNAGGKLHLSATAGGPAAAFPFVRMLHDVALIGLNSAVPTPPLIASGQLGKAQLQELAHVLDSTRRAGLFRLLLIHHPPLPGQASPTRGLKDAAALQSVLHAHGAELVVHGHNHRNMLFAAAVIRGGADPDRGRSRLPPWPCTTSTSRWPATIFIASKGRPGASSSWAELSALPTALSAKSSAAS